MDCSWGHVKDANRPVSWFNKSLGKQVLTSCLYIFLQVEQKEWSYHRTGRKEQQTCGVVRCRVAWFDWKRRYAYQLLSSYICKFATLSYRVTQTSDFLAQRSATIRQDSITTQVPQSLAIFGWRSLVTTWFRYGTLAIWQERCLRVASLSHKRQGLPWTPSAPF